MWEEGKGEVGGRGGCENERVVGWKGVGMARVRSGWRGDRYVHVNVVVPKKVTKKQRELLEKLVDNTDFATGVYDPCGGSGTTLAACEAYGQPSYIMELTPAFTDVIVKRYIRITGKTTGRGVLQGRERPRGEIAAIFEPDEEGGEQE